MHLNIIVFLVAYAALSQFCLMTIAAHKVTDSHPHEHNEHDHENLHNHDHHAHANPAHGEKGHVHGPGCNHGDFSKPFVDRKHSELMTAILTKDMAIIDAIVSEGDMSEINKQNADGVTALMYALGSKQYDVAKALVRSGCNVHLKNSEGVTALALAVYANQLELVQMMVAEGADLMSLATTNAKVRSFLARNPNLINADIARSDDSIVKPGGHGKVA